MTNKIKIYFSSLLIIMSLIGFAQKAKPIKTKIPKRPKAATELVGFAAPKMETVRIGIIGLGMRGIGAVERFTHIPGAEVVALCDIHAERVEHSQKILSQRDKNPAKTFSGSREAWKELCLQDDVDLVYIVTDWQTHTDMSVFAMENGKHVAVEVPGAMTLKDIWRIINTAEKTQKHCMMLENCVYDFFELTVLNMVQKGLLGEILHAEGAYIHNLEDFWNYYENDWRMEFNYHHRGDLYPTHGMGPACQALNIHRGDKMNILVSMDTKAVNIPEYLIKNRKMSADSAYKFQNGQHTMTMIRTEKGKTIHIQHDVASPRPYSRMYQISGTKGFANKYPFQGLAFEATQIGEDIAPDLEDLNSHSFVPKNVMDAMMEKYKHPIHKELETKAKEVGGHGGMDFIMDYRLIYCLRNGLPLDMDVYDLAEWSCLAELSRISIENGSAPVEVPDFTRGAWNKLKEYKHYFVE